MTLSRRNIMTGRPRRSFAAIFAIAALLPQMGKSQGSLVDLPSFRDGCQALADERFQTAITSLQESWNAVIDDAGGDVERDFVASRLLEAFVRNGETDKAANWLREHPLLASSNDTLYWSAIVHRSEKEFSAAAKLFGELAGRLPEPDRTISTSRAVCLTLGDNQNAAWESITALGEPTTTEESLIFAQIATRAGQLEPALRMLGKVPAIESTPRNLRFATIALRAHLLRELGRAETSKASIISLIETATNEQEALQSFLLFEEAAPSALASWLPASAEEWENKSDHPAAQCHRFFLTLNSAKTVEEKRTHLINWTKKADASLTATEASIRLLSYSDSTETAPSIAATEAFPGGLARVGFAASQKKFRAGHLAEAAAQFFNIAKASKGESRARSHFNAAITRLKAADFDGFQTSFHDLRDDAPNSPLLKDLQYAAGLHLAAAGDPRSIEFLEPFVRENPDHPSLADAMLALAEIHLNQAPARPQAASDIFERLRASPLTLDQSERLDYSSIWLEVIRNDDNAQIASATAFLENWPGSEHHAEVAMLLAQTHYQNHKEDTALEIFDRVAVEFPDSPLSARAKFFAARASSRAKPGENDAKIVSRWESIANSDGEYSWQARHELALHHLARDRFELSRQELQKILEGTDASVPLHFASHADFAFSYFAEALANKHDADLLKKAAASFAELSQLPNAPTTVIDEAAVRYGRCLESLDQKPRALEVYRSLLADTTLRSLTPIRSATSDSNEWVFRAGFSAIEILREQKDWKPAIQIADTLARKDGARAIEASRLAEQMRLKHWVWE